MKRSVLLVALLGGVAVAVLPFFFPTGPDAQLDAAGFLESGQFLLGAGVVFAGGLLTALTPCVYPLIPITVSVFGARRDQGRARAVALTSAYVFGMGVVFATLGVVAAKTGALFGSVLADPRFVVGLALFLLLLASSMFGAFELALPSSLATRLGNVGGGGVVGALLMGSVSGFLAAPCTGPVLTGLLAFVAKTQSALLGGGLLFIYALGVGVPFFLIGVFTIRLPKGGAWMESVKSVLGIALVALALSYVRDVLPPMRELFSAWARDLGGSAGAAFTGVIVAVGVLLGAVHLSFKEGRGQALLKAGAVAAVVFAIALRGSLMTAPSTGDAFVRLGWAQADASPRFRWDLTVPAPNATDGAAALASFDALLERARSEKKPVMIDFFAEWCAACKELDHFTYVAAPVISEGTRFLNVKVDATNEDAFIEALYERFGVQALPTVAFIDSEGKVLDAPRVTGFLKAEPFAAEMKKVP